MTGEGQPSEPWNVTAVQRNGTRIEVSWQPPIHPNGVITGYDVFMSPPLPPAPMHRQQKTSVLIDDNFVAGNNYSFWVVARNKDHESSASQIANITFDGSANIDNIEDLKVTDKTNHSVTLSWKKIDAADGYVVHIRGPLSYPTMEPRKTPSNNFVVDGLAPGTRYTFEVSAQKKAYVGKTSSITGMTKDLPLPSVTILEPHLLKSYGTTVKLSWDPPKGTRKIKWQYAVHYALNMQDLYKGMYIQTSNLNKNFN